MIEEMGGADRWQVAGGRWQEGCWISGSVYPRTKRARVCSCIIIRWGTKRFAGYGNRQRRCQVLNKRRSEGPSGRQETGDRSQESRELSTY